VTVELAAGVQMVMLRLVLLIAQPWVAVTLFVAKAVAPRLSVTVPVTVKVPGT